jgi:hypothetical protein
MRRRLLAAATALVLAALTFPSAAQANHSWGNYHWARTANAWTSYLNEASADWTASSVLNTTVVSGSFGSKNSCTPTTGHVEVCNASYGSTGWLGIASISITTGNHISRAYVKVNDTYFNQAQYNTPAYKRLVMCQEVGHTFGLAHQDENQTNPNLGTCMDYTSDPSTNQHPNKHDYDELITIYSHLDSSTTIGASAPASSGAGESPAEWGEIVSASHDGHQEMYARDHGNGDSVLTFVTWAE